MRCRDNVISFLKNISKRHPITGPLGWGMGFSFVDPASDWYFATVPAIIDATSYSICESSGLYLVHFILSYDSVTYYMWLTGSDSQLISSRRHKHADHIYITIVASDSTKNYQYIISLLLNVIYCLYCMKNINSLTTGKIYSGLTHKRPSNAIWRQRSGSTLAQVMACCLTAPSH